MGDPVPWLPSLNQCQEGRPHLSWCCVIRALIMGQGQPLLCHGGPRDMTARFRDSEVWARTHVLEGVALPLTSPPCLQRLPQQMHWKTSGCHGYFPRTNSLGLIIKNDSYV